MKSKVEGTVPRYHPMETYVAYALNIKHTEPRPLFEHPSVLLTRRNNASSTQVYFLEAIILESHTRVPCKPLSQRHCTEYHPIPHTNNVPNFWYTGGIQSRKKKRKKRGRTKGATCSPETELKEK